MPLNRRDFLKITALAGAAAALGAPVTRALLNRGGLSRVTATHYLMGTIVNFALIAEDRKHAQTALQATLDRMQSLIRVYDHRPPGSLLGQLNANGVVHQPPAELAATLRQAIHFGTLSQGAFDVTMKPMLDAARAQLPISPELIGSVNYRLLQVSDDKISLPRPGMAVTLDGIAKGCVVDAGAAFLSRLGFETVLVEAGGDLMANSAQDGQTWQVGLTHPRAPQETITTVSIRNQALATSGDYMNYFSADYSAHHIIDPRAGRSPSQLASASVIAPNVTEADALSTTLMVLGVEDGLALVEKLPGVAALLVTKDLQIFRSSKFPTA